MGCISVVERDDGSRCRRNRYKSGAYCRHHRCAWANLNGVRCDGTSFPGTADSCANHVCLHDGCGRRAENNANRCDDHLCAFGFEDADGSKAEFPICYREPIEPGPYCQLHTDYAGMWARVVEDRQQGGGYGLV